MSKRKNYRIQPQPERLSEVGVPGNLIVHFLDKTGAPAETLDLSAYAARPHLAGELAYALHHHLADKSSASRNNVTWRIGRWFRFLDEHDPNREAVMSMSDVNSETLRAYVGWLDRQPMSKGSRASLYSAIKQPLAWLLRHRPDLMQPGLELPFNPFPRRNSEACPRRVLTRAELDKVLVACRADIEVSWPNFQHGRALLDSIDPAIITTRAAKNLNLNDLGILLAFLTKDFGGLVPLQNAPNSTDKTSRTLRNAIHRHGGLRRICGFLHATPDILVPYMVAIAAQTFANPDALRNMRRNCMTEHPLLEGRTLVAWDKGRAGQVQRRSFLRGRGLSVPNLIDRVLAMTAPLVPHVPAEQRGKLFLSGGVMVSRRVCLLPMSSWDSFLQSFRARHDLRDSEGAPLALTFGSLRPTGLTLAHAALGYDVLKTQTLANHAHPDTTRGYVHSPAIRAEQAKELGRLQGRFVEVIRGGDGWHETMDHADATRRINSRNATASGFTCSDPMAGIAPGQRKGRLCTAWLGCFTCPNAVIPLNVDTLARLLRMRDALADARRTIAVDRWQLLYAPKLEILERDVLHRFPADVHRAAQEMMDQVSSPPPIE